MKPVGPSAKMAIDDKKQKAYYFEPKITPEKAAELATRDGAAALGTSPGSVNVGKPLLKYDFYCIYKADMSMKYVQSRQQELGVNDRVVAAMVGNSVIVPKKGKDVPGKAVALEISELYEVSASDGMTLDGATGTQARAIEPLLAGAGKKPAAGSWLKKVSVSPGKYTSIDKVVKDILKVAAKAPAGAKRIVNHKVVFSRLDGFYVPTYYVTVSAGGKAKIMRVNGLNGSVALKV